MQTEELVRRAHLRGEETRISSRLSTGRLWAWTYRAARVARTACVMCDLADRPQALERVAGREARVGRRTGNQAGEAAGAASSWSLWVGSYLALSAAGEARGGRGTRRSEERAETASLAERDEVSSLLCTSSVLKSRAEQSQLLSSLSDAVQQELGPRRTKQPPASRARCRHTATTTI